MRVSTYSINQNLLRSAMGVQTSLAEALTQQASGLVSDSYGALGGDAKTLLDFQSELTATQTSESKAEAVGNKTETMYDAIGSMTDQLTTLRAALSTALSADSTDSLTTTAQGILEDLASLMNTQYDGHYVFSGSATDTAPVDLTAYDSTAQDAGTADTSYYQGDDTVASVSLSNGQTINYGVTGDNSAFEMALRVAALSTQLSTDPVDSDAVQAAYDLATQAIDAMSELQSTVSVSASRLSDAQTSLTSYGTQLQTYISNLKEVDSAEIAAKVSQYETQLQSSYSAVSTILGINLSKYL